MPNRDFTDLCIEYEKEPFGDVRGDVQAAMIAKVTADLHRGKNPPYKLQEFMPFLEKKKGMSAKEFKASMAHLVKKNGSD